MIGIGPLHRGYMIGRLTREIEQQISQGKMPQEIVLTPRDWRTLMGELGPWFRATVFAEVEGRGWFLGVPVHRGPAPSVFCEGCGAPRESSTCSYCKRPSSVITIDHEELL